MAWRKLTLRDVAAHLSQEEMDAYRQLPDFMSDADPILDQCKEVAAFCRMKLRKNFFVALSPDIEELPPELIAPACDIIAFNVLKRFPPEISQPRTLAYQKALELLDQIQRDDMRPESWKDPDAEDAEDTDEDFRNDPFIVVNIRPTILR